MSQFNLPLVADGLTAYAIERQHEFQSHQRQDILFRMALLESCMDSIFQGMARLDGRTPSPDLMRQVSKRLEEAAGCSAVKTLPLKEQTALIRELSRYVSALEAAGGDRRRQISEVNILLGDMVTHLAWGFHETGLSQAREQTERMLPRMTAQMPIRFTRILLGGERGPCESDFVAGAVTDEEGVRATALYKRMTQQYPKVTEWPVICTVYAGRDLPSALGTVDASDFDLAVMRDAGDRFLDLPGVHPIGGKELRISTHGAIQALKIEPDRPPEAVSVSNTLEALQAAVGGYIEVLDLDCGVCLICNEEGKLLGLPANRRIGDDIIAGTFLIVGEEDGEFCSLSAEDADYYAEQFEEPLQPRDEPNHWNFQVF